jgi:hypothetical protein
VVKQLQADILQQCSSTNSCIRTCIVMKEHYTRWRVVSPMNNPEARGPPFVVCPRLLIQYIRRHPPNWSLFLYPQPEDVLCCGDRDQPNIVLSLTHFLKVGSCILHVVFVNPPHPLTFEFLDQSIWNVVSVSKQYASLNGILHKSFPSVWDCTFPIVARRRLG